MSHEFKDIRASWTGKRNKFFRKWEKKHNKQLEADRNLPSDEEMLGKKRVKAFYENRKEDGKKIV